MKTKPVRITKCLYADGYVVRQGKGIYGTAIKTKTMEKAIIVKNKLKKGITVVLVDLQ